MRIVHDPDPRVLVSWLAERLRDREHGGLRHPVLVIAPTSQQIGALELSLARALGVALGIHFQTLRGLSNAALEHEFVVPPRALPAATYDELVGALSEPGPAGLSSGRRRAQARAVRELREAGVTPAELDGVIARLDPAESSEPERAFADLYRRASPALDAARERGLGDAATLASEVRAHLSAWIASKGIRQAFVFGAYELIGVYRQLVHDLARCVDTTVLAPVGAHDRPVWSYAWRPTGLGGLHCTTPPRPVHEPGTEPRARWRQRLDQLWEPGFSAAPLPESERPALELRHAQGARAELRAAVERALAICGADSPDAPRPDEVAIIARSLEPYAPHIEAVCAELGVPFSTTTRRPAARVRSVRAFLLRLRVLAFDGRRQDLIAHLREEDATRPSRPHEAADDLRRLDDASRSARIHQGLEAWAGLLDRLRAMRQVENPHETPETNELDPRHAERLAPFLAHFRRLIEEREAWSAAGSLEEHCETLEPLLTPEPTGLGSIRASVDPASDDSGAPRRLLRRLRDLGVALADNAARRYEPLEVLELLERLAEEVTSNADSPGEDAAGVRFLEVLQARGLAHRVVIWLGFHEGAFPRPRAPDPILSDALRERITESTGKPLVVAARGAEEEHLLLGSILASTSDRVVISWQRADDEGRQRGRSSALREIARAFTGRADARALLGDRGERREPGAPRAERITAHPGRLAADRCGSELLGALPPGEALAAVALLADHATTATKPALDPLLESTPERLPAWRAALDWVEILGSFTAPLGAADGVLDTAIDLPELWPSHLEHLATCPQRYFLSRLLGARALRETPSPTTVEANVFGNAVHATIAELYGEIETQGALRDLSRAREIAARRLPELWRDHLLHATGPAWSDLGAIVSLLGEPWLGRLRKFVAEDLAELVRLDVERLEFERELRGELALAIGASIELAGRIDRIAWTPSGPVVDDFKTGRKIGEKVAPIELLRARQVQLPLYRELAALESSRQPTAVVARYVALHPGESEIFHPLPDDSKIRAGTLETVGVVVALARSGSFPIFGDVEQGPCNYCDHRRACRRSLPACVARRDGDPRLDTLRAAKGKTKTSPLLGGAAAPDGPASRDAAEAERARSGRPGRPRGGSAQ